MTLDDAPDLLTVQETARILRIGLRQTYEAVRHREIPALRFGRTLRVPKAALVALLDAEPPKGDDSMSTGPKPSTSSSLEHSTSLEPQT